VQGITGFFSKIYLLLLKFWESLFGGQKYPSISVVRPEDMLVLTFDFVNLPLQKAAGEESMSAHLIPGKSSFIIVRFQPQNIAEQAFFESTPGMTYKSAAQKATPPDDPDQANSGADEPLGDLPVGSRLAKPSRLVFKVPEGEGPIPYNLVALLSKIAEYELSVAPTALPPPPKPRRKLSSHIFSRRFSDLHLNLMFNPDLSSENAASASASLTLTPAKRLIQTANTQAWQATSEASNYLLTEADMHTSATIAAILEELLAPQLRAPTKTETSIEAPFRLMISPNRFGAWVHAVEPQSSHDGTVELWHTRLAVRKEDQQGEKTVIEADDPLRTVRAIWTRDPDFKPEEWGHGPKHSHVPFRMSLDSTDRHNLVHLTANYRIKTKQPEWKTYVPEPVEVSRMILTSLGAWLNLYGFWQPPKDTSLQPAASLSVQEWRHRGTLGRDHYVRVVYKGYLLPFCHPASLVKITERKFHPDTPGNIAYLRQRMFIVVQKPLRLFIQTGVTDPSGGAYDLGMPFTLVRLTTLVTPNLDPPVGLLPAYGQDLFWPKVANHFFKFHVVAEDIEKRKIEFDAPLLFISSEGGLAYDLTKMNSVRTAFDAGSAALTTYPLNGQMVAYAAQSTPGNTAFETHSMTFSFHVPDGIGDLTDPGDRFGSLMLALGDTDIVRAYPRLHKANLTIPAVKHLVGQAGGVVVGLHETYLQKGFTSGNRGELFLELLSGVKNMSFDGLGDRAGALVQPNMSIKGLSRLTGPVAGDLAKIASGEFDPMDFFAGLDAYIFGCIPLGEIIQELDPGGIISHPERMPGFITEQVMAVTAFLNDLDRLKESVEHPNIKPSLNSTLVNSLAQDYTHLTTDIQNFFANPTDVTTFKTNLGVHLGDFKTHLETLKNTLPGLPAGAPQDIWLRLISLADQLIKAASALDLVDRLVDSLKVPSEVKVRFEWKPMLYSWKNIFINQNMKTGKPTELLIAVELQALSNYQPDPAFLVICRLANFSINLIGNVSFLRIHFTKVEFFASSSKKPDINVEMDEIEFVGVLSFVQVLKDLIPLDGFSDPPAIEVSTEGIKAGFSLPLPNIAVGMFSLQNLSLGAGFSIPFVGKPLSVRFNFCERHEPFTLTVCMFGGGGFFAITVDPHDVQILEAAIEFGASIAINFGVASGGVTVMAGIYYRIESGDASLAGYFRLHGEVDVLGIISASIELYLELRYEFSSGKCVGRAKLTIEVEVFMFSVSVTIECERKFAGSAGDPTFAEMMEPYQDPVTGLTVDPWNLYCGAFA
jgi:hypothetical protein